MHAYYTKDFARAETEFAAAGRVLREQGLKHELWQANRFAIWASHRLDHAIPGDLPSETHGLLAEMSDSLNARDRILFQLNKATDEEQRLNEMLDELMGQAEALRAKRFLFRIWAQQRWEKAVLAFKEAAHELRTATVRDTLEMPDRRPTTNRDSNWLRLFSHRIRRATITFVVLPTRIAIVRSSFGSIGLGVSPVSRVQLREWVAAWHQALAQTERGTQRALYFGEIVSEALQFPELLAALPKRVRGLTIEPDDVLHGVPFCSLYSSHGFGAGSQGNARRFVVEMLPVAIQANAQRASQAPANPSSDSACHKRKRGKRRAVRARACRDGGGVRREMVHRSGSASHVSTQ